MGNFKLKHVIITGAMIALCILATPGNTRAEPFKFPKMFKFASQELQNEKPFTTPTVEIVSQEALMELHRFAYLRDTGLDLDMKEALGLYGFFDPKTGQIYVGRHLEAGLKEQTIVHEYVHWLQVVLWGRLDWNYPENAAMQHWMQEMQAYAIGQRYEHEEEVTDFEEK